MSASATRAREPRERRRRDLAASVVIALAVSSVCAPAAAHSYRLGDIAIGHLWSPPPEENAQGLPVYGPIAILNREAPLFRMVGAASTVAGKVRFRSAKNGREQWPDALALTPGRPLSLAPWGVHLWLSDLDRMPSAGESFDLTLDFGKAGTLTVKVVVETVTGH